VFEQENYLVSEAVMLNLMLKKICAVSVVLAGWAVLIALASAQASPRARDLGVPFDGVPGPLNAITDVKGVEVGHTTLISGDGTLKRGVGPVRTGVTAVLPRGKDSSDSVFSGWFTLNGNLWAQLYCHVRAVVKKFALHLP